MAGNCGLRERISTTRWAHLAQNRLHSAQTGVSSSLRTLLLEEDTMILSEHILVGRNVVDTLQQRITTPLVVIGEDKFFRTDFAKKRFFAEKAAANFSKMIAELPLKNPIKNTEDFFNRITPNDLAIPKFGAFSMAVLGPIFEIKKLGGAKPIDSWALKHLQNGNKDRKLVSFNTIKHRSKDMRAEREEKKRARKRRRERTREVPVERFGSTAEVSS
jgi:hypothetical protein